MRMKREYEEESSSYRGIIHGGARGYHAGVLMREMFEERFCVLRE